MSNIDQTLKMHKIRPTGTRREILKLFIERDFALSHADIEKGMGEACDRVTIYRTLDTFLENGLIHKIADEGNVAKYALCDTGACSKERHRDQHLHFRCSRCGHTFCLSVVKIPEVRLPAGYRLSSISMIAEGLCKTCADNHV